MRDKFCLPIIKSSQREVWVTIKQNNKYYAFFEVWLDYVEDLNDAFVQNLVTTLQGKLIVVFRRQALEPMHLSRKQRLHIIDLCANTPVFVDLDLGTQKAESTYILTRDLSVKTIISHHDYHKTPGEAELGRLVRRILARQPTVLKIAALCLDEFDALRLLRLLVDLKAQGEHCIILGMGASGVATRIFGTLWGNELIFAPNSSSEQSAPGQLTRQQLEGIDAILKG